VSDTLIQNITTESFSTEHGETITQALFRQEILSHGIVGPPGPAGADGSSAAMPWHEDVFVLGGNQTVFTLSQLPANGSVSLYVNGLRQTSDNFTVVGLVVTVTGFIPGSGDSVELAYQG